MTEQATEQAEALVSGGPCLVWTGSRDLHGPVLGLPRGGYSASVGRLWGAWTRPYPAPAGLHTGAYRPAAWLGMGNMSLSKLVTHYAGKRLGTQGSHHKLDAAPQKSLQEGQQGV